MAATRTARTRRRARLAAPSERAVAATLATRTAIRRPQSAAGAPYSRRRGIPLAAATCGPRPRGPSRRHEPLDLGPGGGERILGRPRAGARPVPSRRRARTRRGPGSLPSAAASPARRAAPDDRLVQLRELAADRSRPLGAARRRKIAQRGRDPRRAPRTRPPARIGGDRRQPLAPLAPRTRQEPLERPARPGDPERRHRGQHGRCPRDRHDRPPRRPRLATSSAPGSLDDRGAGIGHEREVGPAAQVLQQGRQPAGPLRAWKLVIRAGCRGDRGAAS